jgi:hypothetical protein
MFVDCYTYVNSECRLLQVNKQTCILLLHSRYIYRHIYFDCCTYTVQTSVCKLLHIHRHMSVCRILHIYTDECTVCRLLRIHRFMSVACFIYTNTSDRCMSTAANICLLSTYISYAIVTLYDHATYLQIQFST